MPLVVPIVADTSGLVRGLGKAESGIRRFGKIAAIAVGAAAFGGLVKTLQIGTEEFMEQQKVAAQTGAVLKSTGGIANVTARQMEKLSGALMQKSGVDDEAIQSGQNLLLTFTKIRNETGEGNDIFNQATVAMLDLSVAMGKDLNSSAILIGKALNDPIKGASALTRAGVQLTEQQRNQITAFVESGRVLDAQKIILAELTTQFGGSAEAAGKTLPGQLAIAKESFRNLAGEIAGTFLPKLATAATELINFLRQFGNQPTLTAKIKFLVGSIGNIVWNGIQSLYEWWNREAGRVELPARVVLIAPGGRQQLQQIIDNLAPSSEAAGRRLGARLANSLISGSTDGLRGFFRSGIAKLLLFALDPVGSTARFLGENIVGPFIEGFSGEFFPRIRDAIVSGITSAVMNAFPDFLSLGANIREKVLEGFGRKGQASIRNKITDTVRAAIQDARRNLEGAGANLGSMLSTIIGASFRLPNGKNAGEILAEERAIEDERMRLEEERLKAAVDAEDATEEDRLALREFYLNKEKTLRDRALQEEIKNREDRIASLIEEFNTGLKTAEQFSAELDSIIGADRGTELGTAFAGAFSRAIQEIKNIVADIFGVAGRGETITAPEGGVGDVLRAENERRFEEARQNWEDNRKGWRKELNDLLDIDKEDRTAKQNKRIETLRRKLKEPVRADYGLALGGILKQPTFVAGEAGREAVIPLESASAMNILRDAIGGNSVGNGRVINLTVNAGLGTNPDELGRVIVDVLKRYERRNSKVFEAPLVRAAADAGGVTTTVSAGGTFNRVVPARGG